MEAKLPTNTAPSQRIGTQIAERLSAFFVFKGIFDMDLRPIGTQPMENF
jgi:hypothetical protein